MSKNIIIKAALLLFDLRSNNIYPNLIFENDYSENLTLDGVNKASLAIESGVVEMKNNKLIILVD